MRTNKLLRLYAWFRSPEVFLRALAVYIMGSLFAHFRYGYDGDLGMTNLMLSIEASVASAVLMVLAEGSSKKQEEMAKVQREQLAALIEMAEATRQMLADHMEVLKTIRDHDDRVLAYITGGK